MLNIFNKKKEYGPVAAEELDAFKKINKREKALRKAMESLVEQHEELIEAKQSWWMEIRNKYEIKHDEVSLDIKSKIIKAIK